MKRIAVLYLSLAIYAFAQAQFRTQLFVDNVKTLQVIFPGRPFGFADNGFGFGKSAVCFIR